MSDRPTFLAPAGSPADVPPAQTPATPGLGVLVVIAVIAALYQGREVLIPFTLAILLSFLLTPLVELLRRLRLGRILSVVLAVVLALGIIAGLGTAIGTEMAQLAGNIPRYQSTITQKISGLSGMVAAKFPTRLMTLGSSFATTPQSPATALEAKPRSGEQPGQQAPIPVVVTQPAPSALTIGERVLAPIFSPLTTAGIILIVTIFALLQKEDLRGRAIRLFGSSDLHRTTAAMNDAGQRLSRYFLTQLGINTAFGAIVGTGVFFIGVPNPVLWGILGTLLRFIPYIGS